MDKRIRNGYKKKKELIQEEEVMDTRRRKN